MKNYEVLTVFKASLDADEIDKNLSKIEENVNKFEGKIVKVEKIGRKKLAYDIQKFSDGYFVNQIVALPAEKVKEFRRMLKLNDKKFILLYRIFPGYAEESQFRSVM